MILIHNMGDTCLYGRTKPGEFPLNPPQASDITNFLPTTLCKNWNYAMHFVICRLIFFHLDAIAITMDY